MSYIKAKRSDRGRSQTANSVRVIDKVKDKKRSSPELVVNQGAYVAMGKPKACTLYVDPAERRIKLVPYPGGTVFPLHVTKNKRVSFTSPTLASIPAGSYEYLDDGDGYEYQWVGPDKDEDGG